MEISSRNSNYSRTLSAVTVLQLPNELLALIFKYLKGCDVISFASTCKRFSSLSQSVTHLDLENRNSSLGKSLPLVSSFFKSHVNPPLLCSCNLNGCYWISASTLKSLLIKCCNLEELHVADTKLVISEMVTDILPKCPKVIKLSFTLKIGDWLSFAAHLGNRKQPTLCRLKSVELFVADSCSLFETLHFLQSCEKLEEIVVCQARISPVDIRSSSGKLSRNLSTLKSFVFVARNQMEMTAPIVCQFFDVRESSNLTTFWSNLLQLHHCNHLDNLTSVAWTTSETRNQPLPIDVLHPGLQLGHLESYWEPEPILMRSVLDSPTKLKLISCFYDSNNFQNFCENHPLLEVLKLGIDGIGWNNAGNNQTRTVWNRDSWKNLSKLKILSFRAALIEQDKQRLPYLASIVQSCPLIQELEIIGHDHYSTYLSVEELISIAQLGSTLKRLTLANLRVCIDVLFFEQILKVCDQLESLRLKNIGPLGVDPCCYVFNLITALPLAKKLKTFCLFQKNMPQMELLLESLESCPSISHLSLVCPSSKGFEPWEISKEELSSRLTRLCDKLSQLVALFCYIRVPFTSCDEVSQVLKTRFKMERPAFRVDVQSMLQHNNDTANDEGRIRFLYTSKEFPVMYNDLLTSFQSRVALCPYNCNTFLQR